MSFVEGNLQLGIELQPGTLDRLKQQIAQLEKGAAVRLNIDPTPINNANRSLMDLDRHGLRAGGNITRHLGGALKAAGAAAGALGAIGAASLATITVRAIAAGKEFNILQQQVRAGLTAVLGTTDAAERLLQKVNALNDTSPFPRSAFLAATQQLVGFGVQADKVTGILDAVQQAVAGIGGDSNDIAMFTRAFAQIQSQGRLTGDVLFSLGSKGVDAAAIIGKQLGKTGQQIKDEVSKGAIGADQAIDLLTKGLQEKFQGATDNVAKSFLGAKDRVTARLRDIGAAMTSAFITPTGGGAAVDAMNNLATGLAKLRDNVFKPLLPMFQQMGSFLVTLSQRFLEFASSIRLEHVTKLLEVLKVLAPAIALVGGHLATGLTQNIPIIGRLVSALGGPITAIAVLIATVPELRAAFMNLVAALKPIAEALLPAFNSALNIATATLTGLTPILGGIVSIISAVTTVLTPLLGLLNFGPVQAALLLVAGNFLIAKIAGTSAFQSIALTAMYAYQRVVLVGQGAMQTGGKLAAMGAMGRTAMSGIGSAITSILNPANLALAAFVAVTLELNRSKASAQALAEAITKGLDINRPSDQAKALADLDKKRQEAAEKYAKTQATINQLSKGGITLSPAPVLRFFAKNDADNAKKELDKVETQIKDIQTRQGEVGEGVRKQLIGTEWAKQFDTAEKAIEAATAAGIDFMNLRPDKVGDAIDTVVKRIQEVPAAVENTSLQKLTTALQPVVESLDKVKSAQDKVTSSTRSLEDAQDNLRKLQLVTAQELQDRVTKAQLSQEAAQIRAARSADRMTEAQIALTRSQRGLVEATEAVGKANEAVTKAQDNLVKANERLAELEKQRSRLLADVNHEARELARANAAIAASQKSLIDLAQQEEALLREREDLLDEGPDKILAADRAIERAKISLNNARREEIELQNEINRQNMVTIDMTGMSLDEIKSRLAGAKASLAAQKAMEKSKGKEEENADKLKTAELNRVDAEYALKQAIEARGDVEADLAIQKRENEEALNQIQIDREEINRRIEEQHIDLNILMEGETTKAKTLKGLNEEIKTAVEGVKTATEDVTTAVKGVQTAHENVVLAQIEVRDREDDIRLKVIDAKNEVINLRDEQRNVRDAAFEAKEHQIKLQRASEDVRKAVIDAKNAQIELRDATAVAKGDNEAINRLLWERIGLNGTLLKQNPEIAKKLAEQLVAMLPAPQDESTAANRDTGKILNELINAIVNKPQDVIGMLKNLGILPHAEGAIIRQHTVAQLGEYGKAEVVLPLTKPARAMTLLAQSIPLMHTSLQKKIAPLIAPQTPSLSIPPAVSSAVSSLSKSVASGSGKPVTRKADGPVTYGQMQELITLMNNLKSETHIEAPVHVTASYDEDELMRKLTKKLERHINYLLDKRR